MSSLQPHTHKDSLPSEVEPHDRKHCSLCQAPMYRDNGEINMVAFHHALETHVANGVLRKLRNSYGEISYIEYAKGVCVKCGVIFDIAHPEIAMTFCESCSAFQDTEEARARFRERV